MTLTISSSTYVASTLNNLGNVARKQGKYKEAKKLFQRSLVIKEKALGINHSSVAVTLYNLGMMLVEKERKYGDAYLYVKRALSIWEKNLPADHPTLVRYGIPLYLKVVTKLGKRAEIKRYRKRLREKK